MATTPLIDANVTADPIKNTLTFNTPGNPTTPFDPGLAAGDPFIYQGPETPSDAGIGALTVGQTYFVVLTSTPGVIQLDDSTGKPRHPGLRNDPADDQHCLPDEQQRHRRPDQEHAHVQQFGRPDHAVRSGLHEW